VLLFFAFEVMTKAPLTHLLQIPQVPLICQVRQVAHDEGNPGPTLRLLRFSVLSRGSDRRRPEI
jgi:hypothetical protein